MAIERVNQREVRGPFSNQGIFLICIAFAVTLAYAPASLAQTVIDGPTVSLASLTNTGGDLVVGDKDFTDFSIQSLDFTAGEIGVTPITKNGDFGIRFSGPIDATAGGADLILNYQVSVTNSANLISAANLSFIGSVNGGPGFAEVTEEVETNNLFAGEMSVFATATSNKFSDSLAITPPQPLLALSKDVVVDATLPVFASISEIDQTFTQVPEPSVLVLVAAGFAGFALLRRRRQ